MIDARGSTLESDRGNVYTVYDGPNSADMALTRLSGLVISGSVVKVSRHDVNSTLRSEPGEVVLNNALNDDDFEDDDCLNESLKDIRSLAEQCGIVGSVLVELSGGQRKVRISFPFRATDSETGSAKARWDDARGDRLICIDRISHGLQG